MTATRPAKGWSLASYDPVEPAFELDCGCGRPGELGLDRMPLRRPAGRHPPAARWCEDQRPSALAHERQAVLLEGSVPELEPQLLQVGGHGPRVADEPELREAGGILESPMSDDLDDVPGRVVEVERPRVPVLKVEYLLAGGQLVEALPGRKKGEVVEGLALARLKRTTPSRPRSSRAGCGFPRATTISTTSPASRRAARA